MYPTSAWLLLLGGALRLRSIWSFAPPLSPLARRSGRSRSEPVVALRSGRGVAAGYSWREEAYEIDVSVPVPRHTRTQDVVFRATTRSVELRLRQGDDGGGSSNGTDDGTDDGTVLLLDPARPLRGRVCLDGTYWILGDDEGGDKTHRTITVTIEKLIRTPRNDFEVVEYDWKGVYKNDADEVTLREYDEPEELDVRKYAASLGVDIDNIDMSKVDKTMFSSKMNLTRSALDELTQSGLAREVTQQSDGSEYTVDDEGNAQRVPSLEESMGETPRPRKIPLLDTDSPWHNAAPVHRDPETNQPYVQETREFTRAAFAEGAALRKQERIDEVKRKIIAEAKDPIDAMTVERLKEVLKTQGLKTSGSKQELKDRLRAQVNALLQGKQNANE